MPSSLVPTLLHIDVDLTMAALIKPHLERRLGIRHLGPASSGRDGLAMCRMARPSVIVLEVLTPDMDGFKLVEEIAEISTHTRIVILTSCAGQALFFNVSHRGLKVHGAVLKTLRGGEEVVRAIASAMRGSCYFCSEYLLALNRYRRRSDALYKILTNSEQRLLPKMIETASDEDIAQCHNLSVSAIVFHRKNIMTKLGLNRRDAFVRWGVENGFFCQPRICIGASDY